MNFLTTLTFLFVILALGILIGYSVKSYIDKRAFENYLREITPSFEEIENKKDLPTEGGHYYKVNLADNESEFLVAEKIDYSQIDFPNSLIILFKSNDEKPFRILEMRLNNSECLRFPKEDDFVLQNFNSFFLVFRKEDEDVLDNAKIKFEDVSKGKAVRL
ncbi:MAG: hypothetical protein ACI4HK_08710 [Ruminococcus sp.]